MVGIAARSLPVLCVFYPLSTFPFLSLLILVTTVLSNDDPRSIEQLSKDAGIGYAPIRLNHEGIEILIEIPLSAHLHIGISAHLHTLLRTQTYLALLSPHKTKTVQAPIRIKPIKYRIDF
jgi:hypothetical protein